jgi:uncharacterized membrane protein YkvA (DUF1232 family)
MENHWQVGLGLIKKIPAYTKLTYNLYCDEAVPKRAKLKLSLGIAYNLSPVDLVPGFLPVLGQLDDLIVMLFGIRAALRLLPEQQASRHLQAVGFSRYDVDDDLESAKILFAEIIRGTAHKAGSYFKRLAHRVPVTKKRQ